MARVKKRVIPPTDSQGNDQRVSYGEPIKIYDFRKGLWTVKPTELLPEGATPDARNVWYDEESALTKMPGTELLLAEAFNEFVDNPVYQLFVHHPITAEEILIIQAMDTSGTGMKVFKWERAAVYPDGTAAVDITPSTGLTSSRRCYFADYKHKLYMANGLNNLKSWDNNIASTWDEWHRDEAEHYTFLLVWDERLIGLKSQVNPYQLIYTEQNGDDFSEYYNDEGHWKKIPELGHITGGCVSPYGSLLVFGRNAIAEIQGSFTMDGDMRHIISKSKGTVAHNSIQVWGDNVVFAAEDGLYALSRSRIAVSGEDENLRTEEKVKPLSGEIQNFWDLYVTLPEPGEYKQKLWSGYGSFTQTIAYDTGTNEIEVYDEIFIGTDRCLVVYVTLDSGTWAGGDAAGTLYVTRMIPHDATISDNENILVGSTQSAKVAGSSALAGSVEESRGMQCNVAPLSSFPDVVNFAAEYNNRDQTADVPCIVRDRGTAIEETSQDSWVSLQSIYGKDAYFSQSFCPKDITYAPPGVYLYLKETGDVSEATLKVYFTDSNLHGSTYHPNFRKIYGEASVSGSFLHGLIQLPFDAGEVEIKPGDTVKNAAAGETASGTVVMVVCTDVGGGNGKNWSDDTAEGDIYLSAQTGTWANNDDIYVSTTKCAVTNTGATADSSPISTGCFVYVPFTYRDYVNICEVGTNGYSNIVVKIEDDTSSNYLQWGYLATGTLTNSKMVNSDEDTPSGQSTADYTFKFPMMFYEGYVDRCYMTFDPVQADSDLKNWVSIYVELDDKTTHTLPRESKIEAIYYKVQAADSDWGSTSWTETTNGGAITGTDRWLKLKIQFARHTGSYRMDSITMKSVSAKYETQTKQDQLVASAVWENRYWFSTKIIDYKEQAA